MPAFDPTMLLSHATRSSAGEPFRRWRPHYACKQILERIEPKLARKRIDAGQSSTAVHEAVGDNGGGENFVVGEHRSFTPIAAGAGTSLKWAQRDSNPQPTSYEPAALTVELWALNVSMIIAHAGRTAGQSRDKSIVSTSFPIVDARLPER